MAEATIIELEDNGQDFTRMILDENGMVLRTEPFQSSAWAGAYIPVESLVLGEECHIHHPPNIVFGFLKHKVESITPSNQSEL